MIHRNRCNRRFRDFTKAKRKADIIHAQNDYWSYASLHELSKGKIHCSCPMCASKTNTKNLRSKGPVSMYSYESNGNICTLTRGCRIPLTGHRYRKNWKVSDLKKIQSAESAEKEYIS